MIPFSKASQALTCVLPFYIQAQTALFDIQMSYHSRACYALVNAVRIDPPGFGTVFTAGDVMKSFSPVQPYYADTMSWVAAEFHSKDQASCNKMSHTSCNGTDFATRTRSFVKDANFIAENVAAGQRTPLAVMDAWLHSTGHRSNIMSSQATRIGVGYALGGSTPYWTQSFADRGKGTDSLFAGGAHLILTGSKIQFFININNKKSATINLKSIHLILNGAAQPLSLVSGKASLGTYALSVPLSTACRKYLFEVVRSDGVTARYPHKGTFATTGEAGCTENWSGQAAVLSPNYHISKSVKKRTPASVLGRKSAVKF